MHTACPNCHRDVVATANSCGHCGAVLGDPTARENPVEGRGSLGAGSGESKRTDDDDGARFAPGTVVAQRYRIVALIGRGGMGEVYRADDLKLDRPVALKFLPARLEREPALLNRLLNEVRIAVRVSHPNVCRVHDVQQEAGRHFITMEFVDGDDLSILLRRIGRMQPEKALEIARQLCAGLNAAHAAGVLHRDLKPANVLIDGRGQVKITDFGIAGLVEDARHEPGRRGTPAYMAPEQLRGAPVTVASDVYALGLVLYELYTGRRVHEATTLRDPQSRPTSPSEHFTDIDPAVERVILRCLENEPQDRPRSPLAVSTALPGGDPLGDALAAGELPAPELVAEAGAEGGLRPRQFGLGLALLLGGLALCMVDPMQLVPRVDPPKPVAVLEDRAREILDTIGYTRPPVDRASGFANDLEYLAYLSATDSTVDRWDRIESPSSPALVFRYLEAPDWIRYEDPAQMTRAATRSTEERPGTIRLGLDPGGRLLSLDVVPPGREAPTTGEVDWEPLLVAAGFDPASLTPVTPEWVPPDGATVRRAWRGTHPGMADVPVRIEAGGVDGRPAALRIFTPWSSPETWSRPATSTTVVDFPVFSAILQSVALVVLVVLAWTNVRHGRGDRRTAFRFALALTAIRFMGYVLSPHVPDADEIRNLHAHIAWSMFRFFYAFLFYLAFEPFVRRLWPRMLTSWVRLLSGRLQDPLAGRDVFLGLVGGILAAAVFPVTAWLSEAMGIPVRALVLTAQGTEAIGGFSSSASALLGGLGSASIQALMYGSIAFALRFVLRRDGLVLPPMVAITTVIFTVQFSPLVALGAAAVYVTLNWFLLFRIGLLSFFVAMTIGPILFTMPLTLDLSAWWSTPSWVMLVFLGVLTWWSARAALAGTPVFRFRMLDEGEPSA